MICFSTAGTQTRILCVFWILPDWVFCSLDWPIFWLLRSILRISSYSIYTGCVFLLLQQAGTHINFFFHF